MPIKVTMPALSPTMTDGTLAKWLKSEGDMVESGDVIAEIETDKATMEVEAVDEGRIVKILVSEGAENVPVNDVIAILAEEDEGDVDVEAFLANENSTPVSSSAAEGSDQGTQKEDPLSSEKQELRSGVDGSTTDAKALSAQDDKSEGRIFASPLAKRIAKEKGIDLSAVKGSGPRGRIVKDDLENVQAGAPKRSAHKAPGQSSAGAAPQSSDPDAKQLADMLGMDYEEIPNNNIKKVTAKRLLESKQTIPHFYLTVECQLDQLLAARKELNDKANGAYKISVNDFIIKAAAQALKAYPEANVSWTDGAVLQYQHSQCVLDRWGCLAISTF